MTELITKPPPTDALTPEQLDVVGRITHKLTTLGVDVRFTKPISVGPILSVYRFAPSGSTKVSHIESLASDLAIALAVEDVVVKRMPGESSVAVFVPNKTRTEVKFTDTVTAVWRAVETGISVPLNFGVDYLGRPFVEDLASLPHVLICGSTGGGKTTLVNGILASLIYCCSPKQVNLVLSDTKQVEFVHFEGAPHLLFPPAKTPLSTLDQLEQVIEDHLNRRLKRLATLGVQNIHQANVTLAAKGHDPIPFIVVVIDELADLLLDKRKSNGDDEKKSPTVAKLAEEYIGKIVQKARATGIYVIGCTQRPAVKVIDGTVKSNFPARLTFRLPSQVDSRTVLATSGAEHLLSQGDMLYLSPTRPGLQRLHAPFTRIEDIKAAVAMAKHKYEGGVD